MSVSRPLESVGRVSIWKKIAGVWVVLFVLGFVLVREQGRGGVVDDWNDWVSREVVNANRDVLVPAYYRWVELNREHDVRVPGDGVEQKAADERIVYSGRVRDDEWMPGAEAQRVVGVEFAAADASTFNQWPPGPVDYAVVLDQLNSMRSAAIGVVSPLQWWDAPEVYFQSLRSQLLQAKAPVVLSLGMTDVAQLGGEPAAPPRALWELPLEVVSGEGGLIEVAGVLDEADPRLGELPGVLSGFTSLGVGEALPDAEHGRVKVPLLAVRGERVVVALPLALVMAADQVKASEVSVVLGDAVRWRDRRVPIDRNGCYDIAVADALRDVSNWVSAVRFVAPGGLGGEEESVPEVKGKVVVVARDSAEIPTLSGESTSVADLQLAVTRAIDSGEHRAPVVVFSRLPEWGYWLMLAVVPVVTTVVLRLRLSKAAAALVFLVLLALFFMVYAHMVSSERVLVPTAAPLGIWVAGLCASFLSTKWRVTTRSRAAGRREKMAEFDDGD